MLCHVPRPGLNGRKRNVVRALSAAIPGNNSLAHSGRGYFGSLSVTGLCLAGLSNDEAELREDLGDDGLGGLKCNNLARTPSRNKQLGFA